MQQQKTELRVGDQKHRSAAPKKTSSPSSKGDYYPRSFFDFLVESCPVFARVPVEYQHPLVANMWAATGSRLSHATHAGAFMMHWRSRQAFYGTAGAFHDLNSALGWFNLVAGAELFQHIAQAWKLTEKASALVARYFTLVYAERSISCAGLTNCDGSTYRMPTDAIRCKTQTGGDSKHPRNAIKSAVEIDGDALHLFHNACEAWLLSDPCPSGFQWAHDGWDAIRSSRGPNGGEKRAMERVNNAIVQASATLHIAKSSNVHGYVLPMTYREYRSGRLFAEGAHNLQTCQREVRRAALRGCWDVDVSNCHWSLLQQMSSRLGLDSPAISHYLANKKAVRSQVAMAGGISAADAKQVLIGLIYGMNLKATEQDQRQAIIDLVGPEAAARLRSFPPLLNLYKEVKGLRGKILTDYENRTARHNCIVNDAGNAMSLKASAAEMLAHILQGAEAAILRAVIKEHGPNLRLLAHDGWVMSCKPDPNAMIALIKAQTGYHVELEISQL